VEDLIPGSRYKFRVRSENDYGLSDPSEESHAFDVSGVNLNASSLTNPLQQQQQQQQQQQPIMPSQGNSKQGYSSEKYVPFLKIHCI